jgi:acyl carrier protein
MITHMLLLYPKETVTDEEIMVALNHADDLQEVHSEIVGVQITRNLSPSHQGYTFGLIMRLANEDSLKTMLAHRNYQDVHKELQRLCQHIIEFDGDTDIPYRRKKRLREKISQEEWQKKSAEERLKILLMDQFGVRESEIVSTASFVEDLNADPLDLVEIILEIEDEFGVTISDDEVEKITTIGEALDYLRDKGLLEASDPKTR